MSDEMSSVERGRRIADAMMARAEAEYQHERGILHLSADCVICYEERRAEEIHEAFQQIGEALRDMFDALETGLKAFAEALAGPEKPPTTGPAPRRSKNPKHH